MLENKHFIIDHTIHPFNHKMPTPHYHTYFEMLYIINGNCDIIINNNMYSIKAGTIAFIPANVLHKTSYYGNERPERIYVEFVKEYVGDIIGTYIDHFFFTNGKIVSIPMDLRPSINKDLFEILEEYKSDKYLKESLLKSLFQVFMIKLMRYEKEFKIYEITDLVPAHDLSIQRVMEYIIEHYTEQITLEQLADIAHLNCAYLSKKFKDINGIGFKEYVNALRVRQAKKLLFSTDLSIVEIAFQCGFENSNYFGDVFKKLAGLSPTQYRKQKKV